MRLSDIRPVIPAYAFAVLASTLSMAAIPAQALPAGAQAMHLADGHELTLVSGGCGLYAHRGPYGGCRPNVVARPLVYGRPFAYGYGRPFGYRYGWRGYGWRGYGRRW